MSRRRFFSPGKKQKDYYYSYRNAGRCGLFFFHSNFLFLVLTFFFFSSYLSLNDLLSCILYIFCVLLLSCWIYFFFLISSPTISRKSWKEILLLVEKPSSWARHVSPRALELYVWLGHTTTGTHSVRFCVPFFLILKRMAPSYQRSKHTRISGSHPKWEKKKMDGERPKLGRRRMFMYIYCPVLMDFFFFFCRGNLKGRPRWWRQDADPRRFSSCSFHNRKNTHTRVYIYNMTKAFSFSAHRAFRVLKKWHC